MAVQLDQLNLNEIYDVIPDAVLFVDEDGTIIQVNKPAGVIFGYEVEALMGESIETLIPQLFRDKHRYLREQFIDNPRRRLMGRGMEIWAKRKDGTIFSADIMLSPITLEDIGRAVCCVVRDITERKQAEEKEQQYSQQLASLLEIGQELAIQLDLDALLNLIVKHAVLLLDGNSGGIYLYRPDQDLLEWVVAYGPNLAPSGSKLSINEGVSGKVWATGKGIIIDNYSEWDGRSSAFGSYNWQSIIAVPVVWGKELLGVINVLDDEIGAFTSTDKYLLEVLASLAASAIYNARLFASERNQRLLAETLVEVTLALSIQTDLETSVKEILRQTIRLVPCKTANIALIKGDLLHTNHLIHYDTRSIETLENVVHPLQALPVILNLMNSGEPLIIQDTRSNPEWVLLPGSEWIQSFLAIPIRLQDEVLGVLRLDGEKPNRFSEADAELLMPLANAAAIALSRAASMEMAHNEIHERVQAEKALLESLGLIEQAKQDWEATADSFDQIICLLDANGDIIRINRTVQLWGLGDFTRINGKSMHEVLHPNCPNQDCYFTAYWSNIWPQILAGGQDDFEVQDSILGRYLRLQLRPIVSSYRNRAFFSEGATVKSAVAIIHDITEEKRAEEAIFHTQKLESLGILAGGIAHDFNNLLASVLSENSLALLRLGQDEPARVNLGRAIQTIERAADLTRQLLAYTGKSQSKQVPLNLNSVIKENLLLLQSTIPRQVNLVTNLAVDLPQIMADSGQIQQVVMNLILNAAEAYDGLSGTVTVKTWVETVESELKTNSTSNLKPGQYVCFGVTDKGVGMDEETIDRIYDPFFTTKFTGRGLGLAAVSGIIRQHKGDIQVRSRVGYGTAFKVMLPATEAEAEPEKSELLESPVKNGCVLVIDDEMSIRVAIADFLSYFGQRILTAEDGLVGLELFKEQPDDIDLVILDLTMPAMSGRKTLVELKKIRPDIPVILLSGFSEEEALEQIGESEHVDFLQKPFRLPVLVEKLNALM